MTYCNSLGKRQGGHELGQILKMQKYIDRKLERVGIWLNLKEKSQAFGLGN